MHVARPLLLWALVLGCTPGYAEDALVDGKPCNALCRIWMNVRPHAETARPDTPLALSGSPSAPPVDRSVAAAPQAAVEGPGGPVPAHPTMQRYDYAILPTAPEDRIGPPDVSKLVSERGVVMVETPAEKALNRKQRADLMQEIQQRDPALKHPVPH